jgi:hypothetical protein
MVDQNRKDEKFGRNTVKAFLRHEIIRHHDIREET